MVDSNTTPKAAIAGLLLGIIGMVEVIAAFTPGYEGGFWGLVLAIIGAVICIYSVGKTRSRFAAIGGCVNGVALRYAIRENVPPLASLVTPAIRTGSDRIAAL